jgi:hypothetical protein
MLAIQPDLETDNVATAGTVNIDKKLAVLVRCVLPRRSNQSEILQGYWVQQPASRHAQWQTCRLSRFWTKACLEK